MNALPGNSSHSLFVLASILLLAACGGSGDDGGNTIAGTSAPTGNGTVASDDVVVPPEESCGIPDFAQAMLTAVNQARATARNCGTIYFPAAPPLAWNTLLTQAAAGHSADMANNNFFSHTSSDDRTLVNRIDATGYRAVAWGENIFAGAADVDAAMSGWLASPGHCANIMNSAYKDFGAACVRNDASTYKRYWTQDFAAPR